MTAQVIRPDLVSERSLPLRLDLFLAGGISGCWDWQNALSDKLINLTGGESNAIIANPRRPDGLAKTWGAAFEQISWEATALTRSSAKVFFFTSDTLQPIVLFELGKELGRSERSRLFVYIERGYEREFDVLAQCQFAGHKDPVFHGDKGDIGLFASTVAEYLVENDRGPLPAPIPIDRDGRRSSRIIGLSFH